MRVLITGANGFIGTELCAMLTADGHDVTRLIRYASGRFNGYEQKDAVFADFQDPVATRQVIKAAAPEVIVNLAAISAVAYSFKHPDEVMRVNLNGTVAVAEAAIECRAVLVHASTSEVYGRGDHEFPLKETERLGATSPYAASKIAAEEYIRTQAHTSRLKFVIMRPFNTIGRATVQNRQFVVERAITQAIETGRINLHDPTPRRDFVFRTDHANAYRRVVNAIDQWMRDSLPERTPLIGETFNVCTGDAWSIAQMAYFVGSEVEIQRKPSPSNQQVLVMFEQTPDRPLDIDVLHGSNEKLRRVLGWAPGYSIETGIRKAVSEWLTVLNK